MLTIKRIKEQTEDVLRLLQKKHFEARQYITEVLDLDELRRRTQQELDASLAQQNAIAKEIGALMKQGLKDQAEKIRAQVADLKQLSRQLEEKKNEAEARIREILLQIPNLPAEIVPEGVTGFRFESRNADDLRAKLTAAASLSSDAYAAMQRAALAFAREHFNTENYYPRLISFYNQFVKP